MQKRKKTDLENSKKKNGIKIITNEGGGQYYILNNGQIFDQVGVNIQLLRDYFQKISDLKYLEQNKIIHIGHQEYL